MTSSISPIWVDRLLVTLTWFGIWKASRKVELVVPAVVTGGFDAPVTGLGTSETRNGGLPLATLVS